MTVSLTLEASRPDGASYRFGFGCSLPWLGLWPHFRGCSDEEGHLGNKVSFFVTR
jgi:hypothetical protein